MPRPPCPTNPLLFLPNALGSDEPLPQDIREALDPDCVLPSLDEQAVLRAIARLDPDAVSAVALRDVARECGWALGVRVSRVIAQLRTQGYITYRERVARTIRLTDDGWHVLGRLSPRERIWREGFSAGQAAVMTEFTVTFDNGTTRLDAAGWKPTNETLAIASR